MDIQWNSANLQIEVLAQTDREHRVTASVVKYGRVALLCLATLSLLNYLVGGPLDFLIVLTFLSAWTAITRVRAVSMHAEGTGDLDITLSREE